MNDMGLMGFTKWYFRTQQILIERLGDKPARFFMAAMLANMMDAPSIHDSMLGWDGLMNKFMSPWDWITGASPAPVALLTSGR